MIRTLTNLALLWLVSDSLKWVSLESEFRIDGLKYEPQHSRAVHPIVKTRMPRRAPFKGAHSQGTPRGVGVDHFISSFVFGLSIAMPFGPVSMMGLEQSLVRGVVTQYPNPHSSWILPRQNFNVGVGETA
jgi:hypothetical protein